MFSNSEAKNISKLNYLQGIYECEKNKKQNKTKNADGAEIDIYLNQKFQWPQEGLNFKSLLELKYLTSKNEVNKQTE